MTKTDELRENLAATVSRDIIDNFIEYLATFSSGDEIDTNQIKAALSLTEKEAFYLLSFATIHNILKPYYLIRCQHCFEMYPERLESYGDVKPLQLESDYTCTGCGGEFFGAPLDNRLFTVYEKE